MPFSSQEPTKISERKILIHCTDGYTESTLLGLSYYTYATGLPVPTAWLDLHVSKRRNLCAYPSDVALLTTIAPRLLSESPVHAEKSLSEITDLVKDEPEWIKNMDGSLPSRVTDYMYLGNLGHANNPDLLRHMGIRQILSVGETASWRDGELENWGKENIMVVQRVQDNGVDPLTEEFERCLEFIGEHSSFSAEHLLIGYRSRKSKWYCNACPLPSRRLEIGDDLHCRSDAVHGTLISACILLCSRTTIERYYPTTSTLLL